jgi:hypothetical protein
MGIIPMSEGGGAERRGQRGRRRDRGGLDGAQQADGGQPVGHAQLADNVLEMAVGGFGRDAQVARDILGRPVLRRQLQALALPRRQGGEGAADSFIHERSGPTRGDHEGSPRLPQVVIASLSP